MDLAQFDCLELSAFRTIGDPVCGDAKQPSRERRPAPFEARETLQRIVEDVGGEILRLIAIVDPTHDESVHAFEIVLVKLGEASRVALCGLDQAAFQSVYTRTLQCGSSSH